jgi:YidC/Oxa1 family membrane protein insertase
MDRNSAIGLTLIAILLLIYFNFLAPTPAPETAQPAQVTTPHVEGGVVTDSTTATAKVDSAMLLQYGALSAFATGNEEEIKIDNKDLQITLSNKGYIKAVQLKDFKTYSQQPLYLANDGNNTFSLVANYEGKDIDLYTLYYQVESAKRADTTLLTLTAKTGSNSYIKHIYFIPPTGYQIGYDIQASGISLNGKSIAYRWNDKIPLVEKAMADSRSKTTINYYDAIGDFDGLSEASNDLESEALASPLKKPALNY